MSDIDTAAADSLKVLDPKRPIREADIAARSPHVRFAPEKGTNYFPCAPFTSGTQEFSCDSRYDARYDTRADEVG